MYSPCKEQYVPIAGARIEVKRYLLNSVVEEIWGYIWSSIPKVSGKIILKIILRFPLPSW